MDAVLRAAARRRRSAATSTCTRSRRSPGCSRSATGARSSPRSTSPATGSTATSLHLGRVEVGARRPRRRPQHARPGRRRRRRTPRSPPARRSSAPCPAGESWSGAPGRAPPARPAGPWYDRPRRRAAARGLARRTAPWRSLIAALPVLAVLAGARSCCCRSVRDAGLARRRARAARCRGCRWRRSSGYAGARRAGAGAGAAARARRCEAGTTRCTVGTGVAGLGDPAGPRRGPHLAVPALLQLAHPGVAAAARRPDRQGRRGLDGAADPEVHHGQRRRVPRRRHPASAATSSAAAGCASSRSRSASARSSATPGMAAPGPQGAQGGLVAVLSAAPRRTRPRPARRGWAARRRSCAARPAAPTTAAPTTRRPGCGSRGPRRGLPAGPGAGSVAARTSASARRCSRWLRRQPAGRRRSSAGRC